MRNRMRRRHLELIQAALEAGAEAELVELILRVAEEEGIDPAVALELERRQLLVCGLEQAVEPSADEAVVEATPEWLETPLPAVTARRERLVRATLRRLRALLERYGDADAALAALAAEPDVGGCEL